jgi:hypothetical protein
VPAGSGGTQPVRNAARGCRDHHPGATGSGQAVAAQEPGGWSIQINARHLEPLPSDEFHECVYLGPGNRPDHPEEIPGGTFTVGASGSARVQMWTDFGPGAFSKMEVIVGKVGSLAQQGPAVLVGKFSS